MDAKQKQNATQIVNREWNRWLMGEGVSLRDARSLPRSDSTHLENRLWKAFQAGVKASETASAEILKAQLNFE